MRNLTIYLILILLVWSCEPRPYELEPTGEYAMFCYLQNDQIPQFIISQSSGVFYASQPTPIGNATLTVYENNNAISNFTQAVNGKYSNSSFIPKPGVLYEIIAEIPNTDALSCTIEMPDIVKYNYTNVVVNTLTITNKPAYCDTIYDSDETDINGNHTGNIIAITCNEEINDTSISVTATLTIDDPADKENFYWMNTLGFNIEFENLKPLTDLWSLEDIPDSKFNSPVFSDQELIEINNIITFNTTTLNSKWLKIELYNFFEQQYEYNTKVQAYNLQQSPAVKDDNTQLINYFKPEGFPESEPVILPNNIENGIGFISAQTIFRDSIELTFPPKEEWIYKYEK